MVKADIPMWIVLSKEYNEDPVVDTLTPKQWAKPLLYKIRALKRLFQWHQHDSSRRLSIFVFVLDQDVERYLIGAPHPALDSLYSSIWNRAEETQWERLKKVVEEKQPKKIGINQSSQIAVADGLTHSLYETLSEQLGSVWSEKFVSAEQLVVHWFLKRSSEEMTIYPFLADLTANLAKTALSNEVILPGITSTTDVVDWIRQKVVDLGINTSFYPTVDVQRKQSKMDRISNTPILPGDIVHLDFGIEYLGLSTDTQQLAYVLQQGESKPPEGLESAVRIALAFEDIVMGQMKPGQTGNKVFTKSIEEAKRNSINAMLYSHPLGVHCHEAGPTIGLYNQQTEIPFKGDFEIVSDSAYALEFNIKAYIPEWGNQTYIYLEQPIGVYENGAEYLTSRQESFYLIR